MAWMIQMANCQVQPSTTHLAGDRLYVTFQQFGQLDLASSFNDLGKMVDAVDALVAMVSGTFKDMEH